MEQSLTFGDILEAADRLSLEEKETLIEVLQRRLVDQRRDELAKEIKAARKEFQAGKCQPACPEELMKEIL
jgi:CO dehydrogenase/acetyl-CoA synthase alpha subunit